MGFTHAVSETGAPGAAAVRVVVPLRAGFAQPQEASAGFRGKRDT